MNNAQIYAFFHSSTSKITFFLYKKNDRPTPTSPHQPPIPAPPPAVADLGDGSKKTTTGAIHPRRHLQPSPISAMASPATAPASKKGDGSSMLQTN